MNKVAFMAGVVYNQLRTVQSDFLARVGIRTAAFL
jgi:hypothetical protein